MAANPDEILKEVNVLGSLNDQTRKILSKDACVFLALLHRTFNATRKSLLQRRMIRQAELDKGNVLDFLPETKHIRENDAWKEPHRRQVSLIEEWRSPVPRTGRWLSTR